MTARSRVSSATVYYDYVNGSDSNGGTSPTDALKHLQTAFNFAAGNFDLDLTAVSWANQGNVGYSSPGITIQMAAVSHSNAEPLTQPIYLRGGPAGPITLRGDPTGENALNYNIYAANSLQGITAQEGGVVICDGFTIRGSPNCTAINGLRSGNISIKNIWFGGVAEGPNNCIGAAGRSQIDIVGPIHLIGSGFYTVFSAIESAGISLTPGHEIDIHNAMNFGIMCNISGGDMWTQGSPANFTGHKTDSSGSKYNCYWGGRIMFNANLIPGSSGGSDAQSTVLAW